MYFYTVIIRSMEDILVEKLETIKLKNEEAFIAFNETFKSSFAKKGTILEHPNSVCKYLYIEYP